MPVTDVADLRAHLRRLADEGQKDAQSVSGCALLQRRIDALPVAAIVADDHGRFVAVNEAAAILTGYTVEELRRLSVWQITPGVNEHEAESLWRAFVSRREQYGDYQVLGRGGQ